MGRVFFRNENITASTERKSNPVVPAKVTATIFSNCVANVFQENGQSGHFVRLEQAISTAINGTINRTDYT